MLAVGIVGTPLVAWACYAHRRWQESVERERFVLAMKAASTPRICWRQRSAIAFGYCARRGGLFGAGSRINSDMAMLADELERNMSRNRIRCPPRPDATRDLTQPV